MYLLALCGAAVHFSYICALLLITVASVLL